MNTGKIFQKCSVSDVSLFQNQFVMGPSFVKSFQSWKKISIDDDLKLMAHPFLNVTQVEEGKKSLTLIGYILDPFNHRATNRDIIKQLFDFRNISELITKTADCGGRWIIIAVNQNKKYLFQDPLGLRAACYTNPKFTKGLWVLSQPGLAAFLFNLNINSEAKEYVKSKQFKINPEYRWPCSGTAFEDLSQLLPNHHLNLVTGSVSRFWPHKHLENINVEKAATKIAALMQGLIKAADSRFDLALGITAGIDSRLVMAASKDIIEHITFYTIQRENMSADHSDIIISARLLEKFGFKQNLVKAANKMSYGFYKIFMKNVFMAHEHYGLLVEPLLKYFSKQKVAMTGGGAEVGKARYRAAVKKYNINPQTADGLAKLVKMDKSQFAKNHIQAWMPSIKDRKNLNILDLFQWEHAFGNWLASTQLEFNLAWQDIFTPYNCRSLLTTMLSVDEKYRMKSENRLSRMVIQMLWPELLCEPINPKTENRMKVTKQIRKYFRKLYYHFRLNS
jgi:hypothetical protein